MRKLEINSLASESLVDLTVCIESIVDATPLLLIQYYLRYLRSIFASPDALAHYFHRINKIVQYGIMNSCQRPTSRSFLLLRGAGPF